jgi:hypothetical protein
MRVPFPRRLRALGSWVSQAASAGRCPPARILIRTPAVAATDGGRRDGPEASGCAKRVMPPNSGARIYRPAQPRDARAGCASASRCSGRPPTFPDHGALENGTPSAVRHRTSAGRLRPLPRAHPHPHAGGRGAGPRAAWRRTWRPAANYGKRVMATQSRRLRPSGSLSLAAAAPLACRPTAA